MHKQTGNPSQLINQSSNQSINKSVNQPINQSINRSTKNPQKTVSLSFHPLPTTTTTMRFTASPLAAVLQSAGMASTFVAAMYIAPARTEQERYAPPFALISLTLSLSLDPSLDPYLTQ
jgi:hypothetical protein